MNRHQRRQSKEEKKEKPEGKKYSTGPSSPKKRQATRGTARQGNGSKGGKVGPFRWMELALIVPASLALIAFGAYSGLVKKTPGPSFFSLIIGITGLFTLALRVIPKKRHWLLLVAWTILVVSLLVSLQLLLPR